MNTLYRTHISDKLWLIYDIPGNVGWITYTICAARAVWKKKDPYNFAAFIPAAFMLVGVSALLGGSLLCTVFAGLLLKGYKKEEIQNINI